MEVIKFFHWDVLYMVFKAISESTYTLSIFTIITPPVVLRFISFLRQNIKYFHVIHIIIFSPGILSQILLPSRDTLRYAGRSLNARYCALEEPCERFRETVKLAPDYARFTVIRILWFRQKEKPFASKLARMVNDECKLDEHVHYSQILIPLPNS